MPTVLISGAASGLGAAFLQAYQKDPTNTIIAIDQDTMGPTVENVHAYVVDVASPASVGDFAVELGDGPIDLLIHSAGIRGLVPRLEREKPEDVAACETIDAMDLDTMVRTFQVNAAGTFLLLRGVLPHLRRATNAKVIVMSSRMGSIGNNEHPNKDAGNAYAYRASKAAVNTIVRSFAADVPSVSFILCHPGRVETQLVKCKEEGAISAAGSVNGILPLIENWGRADSGKFYDRFGEVIQW